MASTRATLSCKDGYSKFTFNGVTITFMTSDNLERYVRVLEWDHGYIVALAQYKSRPAEEEYIDLVPILENLYMDADKFLEPIKEVVTDV